MRKRSKYSSPKRKSSKLKPFLRFLFWLFIFLGILHFTVGYNFLKTSFFNTSNTSNVTTWERIKLARTYQNYKKEVVIESEKIELPTSYFLALIALESSGKESPKTRFESKIFDRLKACRDGETKSFGSLKQRRLRQLSNGALKNLASSWGPFQLMGYHAYELGIYVNDIRGKEAVKYGMKWIKDRYGSYLSKREYENAFHIHNTGQTVPKSGVPFTHDPEYIEKGMRYIDFFEKELSQD